MAILSTAAAVTRFKENENRIDAFVNTPVAPDGIAITTYSTNLVPVETVETLPSLIARIRKQYLAVNVRGAWAPATVYVPGDIVTESGIPYIVVTGHTSTGTIAGDVAAGYIIPYATAGSGGGGTGDATYATLAGTTGAGLIGIADTAGNITATTVEAALAELALFKAQLALTTAGNGAAKIGIEDSALQYTATTVEGALVEIDARFDADVRKPVSALATFQPKVTLGGGLRISDGVYTLAAPITVDYSAAAFPAHGTASARVDIVGDSQGNTIINAPGINAINMAGEATATSQGVHGLERVADLTLKGTGSARGLRMDHKAYTTAENLTITGFSFGLWLNGVLSSQFNNLYLTGNSCGVVLDFSGSALLPNANLFSSNRNADNSTVGFQANMSGATNLLLGGSNENNGTTSGTVGEGGEIFNLSGANGNATWTILSRYYERNAGQADIVLRNTTGHHMVVTIIGCTFNRTDSTHCVTTHIKLENPVGGSIKCVLVGCGFWAGGTYVANAGQPLWQADARSEVIDIGCSYHNVDAARTVSTRAAISGSMSGVVESNGAGLSVMPADVTVSRTGTGVYRISRPNLRFALDQFGYCPAANVYASAAGRATVNVVSNTAFDVYTFDAAGLAGDQRFSWSVNSFA